MLEMNLKEAAQTVIIKKREMEKSIAKLIDAFEKEAGCRLNEEIRFNHVSDDSGGYVASIRTNVAI